MTQENKLNKEYNSVCLKCQRRCKQQAGILLVECRRYMPIPVQLEFKFKDVKGKIKRK